MFPFLESNNLEQWRITMFVISAVGATLGMFWPVLIKLFKQASGDIVNLDAVTKRLAALRASHGLLAAALIAIAVYLILGAIIGLVMAALGFVALMGSEADQTSLQATGVLSYFTAASAGFTGAAAFEEALKPTK